MINLEVGRTYRTRGGWTARVIYKLRGEEQHPFAVIHKDAVTDGHDTCETHGADGRMMVKEDSRWDLVSLIEGAD